MKIPSTIQILNAKYKVKFDKSIRDRNRCGECDLFEKQILLDPNLTGYSLKQTLWHEIVHAFQFESGMMQFLEEQSAEMMAETFANLIINLTEK